MPERFASSSQKLTHHPFEPTDGYPDVCVVCCAKHGPSPYIPKTDLERALATVLSRLNWYESRIAMGFPYHTQASQMRIFECYLSVLIYLEHRRARVLGRAA